MKIKNLLVVTPLLFALALLWGCDATNPGAPLANQAPETRIVVAPGNNAVHDHYISPSEAFNIQWFGFDRDGSIAGFNVQVDNGPTVFTTSSDSAMAFESSMPDPNNPGQTIPAVRILKVAAVDNEGMVDPSPDEATFRASNEAPSLSSITADFPDSATVGPSLSFSVTGSDPNPSGLEYRLMIDGGVIVDWDERSSYHIIDKTDEAVVSAVEENDVVAVDVSIMTVGWHRIEVQARDLGGALSDMSVRDINVVDTLAPEITSVEITYGSADYYPDGSTFFRDNTTTSFEITGAADAYYGSIQAYRYRLVSEAEPDPMWSDWGEGSATYEDLSLGMYVFHAQCRDYAGVLGGAPADTSIPDSLVVDYSVDTLWIVSPDFSSNNILVVDETKDGAGVAGVPSDEMVDDFYTSILSGLVTEGWDVSHVDYNTHKVNGSKYLSPKDIYDRKLIIWHGDDKAEFFLDDEVPILQEYLNAGGNLILSGWSILRALTSENEPVFNSGFVYKYLRIDSARKNGDAEKTFQGMEAAPDFGYSDVDYDTSSTKLPRNWNGWPACWSFTARHRTDIIGFWKDFDPASVLNGTGCVVQNFSPVNPWKTVTLGFPLFFMREDHSRAFIEMVVQNMFNE